MKFYTLSPDVMLVQTKIQFLTSNQDIKLHKAVNFFLTLQNIKEKRSRRGVNYNPEYCE